MATTVRTMPPVPSDRSSSSAYNTAANLWAETLPGFGEDVQTVGEEVEANALLAATQVVLATNQALVSSNAAISASSAALSAGAVVWVTDLIYAEGDTRYSPIDYMVYRRKTTGGGSTDPSLDPANWAGSISGFATLSGAETLTNKKISAYQYLDRTVTNATATGTVTLDLALGSVFDLTLTGNTTLALSNVPTLSGETLSIIISVTQGATAYSLTWFGGISWLTLGAVAPSAPAANKVIEYVITTTTPGAYKGRKGAAT